MGFRSVSFHLGLSAGLSSVTPTAGFRSVSFHLGLSAPAVVKASTICIFDARMRNSAVQISNGKAIGDTDLGVISYVYNDMKNNKGDVTLPYG